MPRQTDSLYLPIQKFLKMLPRISSVVMSPRMEPRWWRASRRSWAIRSGGRAREVERVAIGPEVGERPRRTRERAVEALDRAS